MNTPTVSTPPDDRAIHACKRCGTCCRKGGPSLHLKDQPIIEEGFIQTRFLYTIREGEFAHDNVKGGIFSVAADIIKLKSRKGSRSCIFFSEADNQCRIYDHRPLECRVLKCWHTAEIEAIYSKDRLTRKDLLAGVKGLWDLVQTHQERCDYGKIKTLVDLLGGDQYDAAADQLREMMRYDVHIRDLVVEKSGIDLEMLDFLFGRPLSETVKAFGLKLGKEGQIMLRR